MKAERKHACVLQSCSDAIEEVFDSKLHIIGGVGLAIGVIMVSVDAQNLTCRILLAASSKAKLHGKVLISLPFPGVRDDLQHALVLRHQEVEGGGVKSTVAPPEISINVA